MRASLAYLRSLNPDLPRPVWTLQAGGLVNAIGNGITMPFLFIYLHNVLGFSGGLSGLVLGSIGVVGLASGGVYGVLVDRFGGRKMLSVSLALMAVGYGALPLIEQPWHAFAIGAVAGLGNGGFWPSQSSLLAGHTEGASRSAAYAMQRVTMNLGIGVGGLLGGLIATTAEPSSFTVLFLLDAATFVVYLLVLQLVPEPVIERRGGGAGTYGAVLRDKPFIGFVALNVVLITVGIAQLVQLLPVFMKNESGVTEDAIGLIFFANTIFIVLFQLPMAKAMEGRRRMVTLAGMSLLWAFSWLIVAATGATLDGTTATLVFGLAVVVFAVGETLQGPILGPVVADMAPPQLRGRYMAISTMSWGIGFVVGPILGGAILDWEPVALWPIAAAGLVAAGGAALLLERRLPESVRRVPRRDRGERIPAAAAPVPVEVPAGP